ncbi:hypothetical protein nbrc107696_27040 [Gordonia spumicola]|uniref:Helix-turn-helix domain-containing protein n=1 Tax=Gordonia spumicola TaxID=589161 RepID=A0A7I9VA50_9ACTN|nr:helix-turn-helix domain-containing protein [Gordonia spumicola]GEE02258.1 hypothetical protein nbrc107696_27040 [Gordonia spumicola]
MSTTTPKKFLLTTAELAESIGVAPKTVRNWRTQGLGPAFVRLSPNDVRYDPADVAEWIAAVKRSGSIKAAPLTTGGAA